MNLLCPSSVKVMHDLNLARLAKDFLCNKQNQIDVLRGSSLEKTNGHRKACRRRPASYTATALPLMNAVAAAEANSCEVGNIRQPKASPVMLSQFMPVMRSGALWHATMCCLQEASRRGEKSSYTNWIEQDRRNSWTFVIITSLNRSPAECCFDCLGDTALLTCNITAQPEQSYSVVYISSMNWAGWNHFDLTL